MDPITQQTVLAAAGAAGGDKVYVDDVFSTYLYEGNSGTQSINNGIDLAGEGGLVWMKRRGGTDSHILMDTLRPNEKLSTNLSAAEVNTTTTITSFNANGFSLGNPSQSGVNDSGEDIVSWTFRKAPGFFDVVTYTGAADNQTISHSLGSVPGMIIVKNLTDSEDWSVYHRDIGRLNTIHLNLPSAQSGTATDWQYLNPTASSFFVSTNNRTGANGKNYVAYIFAHDDAQFGTDSDESIIKCGSYTGTGSGGNRVELGFEPQFLMLKSASYSDSNTGWFMLDTMRAFNTSLSNAVLLANENAAENPTNGAASISGSGFELNFGGEEYNKSGATYIYMAIRRPHKPPETATEVFAIDYGSSSSNPPNWDSGFPVDMALTKSIASDPPFLTSRLMGSKGIYTNGTAAEHNDSGIVWDSNVGWGVYGNAYNSNYISHMFKRAPGFMDVVAYSGTVTGNSDSQTVPHNLGVTPELMLVKRRSGATQWHVYSNALPTPLTQILVLNDSGDAVATTNAWGTSSSPTAPNANNFTVGYATGTGWVTAGDFVAYLFATLPGISKVGSYSATGNEINVNCGFTAGARFVLIKRMNSPGSDWYLWDTTRGYNGTSDNFLRLNSSAAQDDNIANIDDHLDALPAGFTVRASSGVNTSGGTYLYLAIA